MWVTEKQVEELQEQIIKPRKRRLERKKLLEDDRTISIKTLLAGYGILTEEDEKEADIYIFMRVLADIQLLSEVYSFIVKNCGFAETPGLDHIDFEDKCAPQNYDMYLSNAEINIKKILKKRGYIEPNTTLAYAATNMYEPDEVLSELTG